MHNDIGVRTNEGLRGKLFSLEEIDIKWVVNIFYAGTARPLLFTAIKDRLKSEEDHETLNYCI